MGKFIFIGVIVALIALQFIPATKTNPKVTYQVKWDSEQTKEYFYRACADCHSNETDWPWYANVRPVAFFVVGHVDEGRKEFNISVPPGNDERHEAYEKVEEGDMPLDSYVWLHSEADLTDQEKKDFVTGLKKTFGSEKENEPEEVVQEENNDEVGSSETSIRYQQDDSDEEPLRYKKEDDDEHENEATRYK